MHGFYRAGTDRDTDHCSDDEPYGRAHGHADGLTDGRGHNEYARADS